ncbi:VWA domain-containing protein [Polyangium jinanense]|uniref:VWA domain-containing protein n=1 Tax=Polyangium jinanense TaxID=2829994 RepID=A0A9X4AVI5_9BACT|nr:VWA domain-containing protein [Polyangium jinanense]MDC3985716.1 VWA domain-containing protein [Polyangium jinanense]
MRSVNDRNKAALGAGTSSYAWVTLVSLLALLLAACGGGLNVRLINSAQKKPNNVWVFFTVDAGKDKPVGGLAAEDFKIYEDGELVSAFESKQTIQNPEVAAVMYTMLLVDMSGSVTESGQADALVDAAKAFAERVGKTQKVGVYAFDGSEKIHSVVPFTEAQGSVEGGLEGLRSYKPKDPSTNLHGAVVEGLATLKKELDKDKRPLKFGSLVVFSDGTDRAARVTRDQMKDDMGKDEYENYQIYAIGVGAEIGKAKLDEIGRDGTELATDQAKVKEAFDKMAARIEAHMKRFYLLSYCTPARKGEHEVTIEAISKKDPEGSGEVEYKFNADGFGPPPDCDPKAPPAFDLKEPAPKPAEAAK